LTEHGYDNTSTNRIAERAGVSIGSLYHISPTKKPSRDRPESVMSQMTAIVEAVEKRLLIIPLMWRCC